MSNCKAPADGWAVLYEHWGQPQRFITMEKSRAISYAQEHHGVIYPFYVDWDYYQERSINVDSAVDDSTGVRSPRATASNGS